MNYLEFFELSQEPFSNAPVARFYYDSQQHHQALLRLRYAVENMKGLAVLVGEIGAGKTTLARRLLDSLPEEEYEAALLMIVHAETTASWLLSRIALLLGVENPADDKLRLLSQLYQRLVAIHESGRKAVVLIDEAQMLRSQELMEEFRGLLNLELTEKKLLSFVFFGLRELDQNLHLDEPLNQRVAVRVRLDPLNRTATAAYVAHRLKLAGARRPLFSEAAIDALHGYSCGIPRLINTVCDNALLEAFFLRQAQVDEAIVVRVGGDLGLVPAPAEARPPSAGIGERPVAPRPAAEPAAAAPAPARPAAPPPATRTAAPPPPERPASAAGAAPASRPVSPPRPAPVAPAAAPSRFVPAAAGGPPAVVARAAAPAAASEATAIIDLAVDDEIEPDLGAIDADALETLTGPPEAIVAEAVEALSDVDATARTEPAELPSPPAPAEQPAPAAAPAQREPETDIEILEAIDELADDDNVEIPQIDALDDIDSILDQLEEKG